MRRIDFGTKRGCPLRCRTFTAVIGLTLLFVAALPGRTQVVYDNFLHGNYYEPFTGWAIDNTDFFGDQSIGHKFTPSGSGLLKSVELGITVDPLFSAANQFYMYLYTDDSGALGTLLETWIVLDQMQPFGTFPEPPPVLVGSQKSPKVTAGVPLWLVIGTAKDNTCVWNLNATGAKGDLRWGANGSDLPNLTTDTFGAFRVTVVPEASTWTLLVGGGLGCAVMMRRRRPGRRRR